MSDRLLAIDWGSSALRGALLDADGRVLEERRAARGLLTIEPGGFAAVFDAHFGDWMRAPGTRCLMAGMVGSRQGWVEAPYCPCPAGLDELAAALTPVRTAASGARAPDIAIVPGLSCDRDGVPDVMRGEEVKVLGVLELLGADAAEILMPGTHSKWASVAGGRIHRFATAMSGEFYALLREHSILARTLPAGEEAFDADAFDRGVDRALHGEGLLQTAFSVRTLALFERLSPGAGASYLSGLVIGEELRGRPLEGVAEVVVVGAPHLAERFERALRRIGRRVRRFGEEAAWRGLWAVQRRRDAGA
jgi:2-dehydro-3-deoxygalactonokinase